MTSIRPFRVTDLFRLAPVNLDALTETFFTNYYLHYLITWPHCFSLVEQPRLASSSAQGTPFFALSGYVMGKIEGEKTVMPPPRSSSSSFLHPGASPPVESVPNSIQLVHGHVSALSIAPPYRRLGLSHTLMSAFEQTCISDASAFFVDLFVRASNLPAIAVYQSMGYVIFRQVRAYYSASDDAYDMRKSLPADPEKRTMRPRVPLMCEASEVDAT